MRSRRPIAPSRKRRASMRRSVRADGRREVHLREDVALEIDAGRDLDQLEAAGVGSRNTQRSVT